MILITQAKQYLEQSLGVNVPDFLLSAAIDTVEEAEPAMIAAGYSEAKQVRVQAMAVALVAASGDPKRTQSQHAPSNASRSFAFGKGDLSALRRALAALDTAGTVADLIGPDPVNGTLFVVTC